MAYVVSDVTDDEYRTAAEDIIATSNATGSSRHWLDKAAEVKRAQGGAWVEAWVWVPDSVPTPPGTSAH